jgi:hypothetical protein
MKDKHITGMLESESLASLSEEELASIRAHVDHCADCRRSYEAAKVSTLLLREGAIETFEPSPFFQTRVLAALRERRAANEIPVFLRMWRTAGALVSSMAAIVVLLAIFTIVAPDSQQATDPQELASASELYSAEDLFFEQEAVSQETISYEQVLTTLYASEEEMVR